MICVTESAAEQIRHAATASGAQGLALRLAVRQLPDDTLDYGMGFDSAKPDDILVETHGITVLIAPPYQTILNGLILDYVELSSGEFNFIFQNPNDPQHGISG
jgi:iron-sulfur cluster assembly protein